VDDPQIVDAIDSYEIYDDDEQTFTLSRKVNRERRRSRTRQRHLGQNGSKRSKRERVESRNGEFRCKECKTIVGVPISGGRHRNHCPLCLYSRHVDRSTPGDRVSDCRSMMRPVGLCTRRDGEQMLVHECLGCGVIRHNRVAADDNVVATMRLPIVPAHVRSAEHREAPEQTA
jgi:hypothetical protein